jgi:hypothetical protein
MSINERIKHVIDVLQAGSRKEFATKVGISAAQVYNIIGVNGRIGEKNLSKILLAYPTVAQSWLRKEEGAMLTDGTTPAAPAVEKVIRVGKAAAGKKAPRAKKNAPKRAVKLATEADATSTKAKRGSKKRKAVTPKKEKPVALKTKKARSIPAVSVPAVENKKAKVAAPRKERAVKEPKLTIKKIDVPADFDSKPIPAVNALISGQRELIATNTKLVEANQQLVDLVLKMVKK